MRIYKTFLVGIFCLVASNALAQFGVSFHQSNLPFIGFNYQIGEKWLPEARVSVDNYFYDLGVEITANYIVKSTEEIDLYTGLGGRLAVLDGIMIPVGINVYPFQKKGFGFHLELAGLIPFQDDPVLRGSWGIRYRFLNL